VEDGISGGSQHYHETCCKKGGHRGRRAYMVQRWFHHGDIVSRQVDLYMTYQKERKSEEGSRVCRENQKGSRGSRHSIEKSTKYRRK